MMHLTCPKCQGDMRQYERSGVTVDQCSECRGIFLDRGELEKLFEAEANWNQQGGTPPRQPSAAPAGGYAPPPPPGAGYPPPPAPGQHQPGYPTPGHAPPPPVTHGYPPAPVYGQQHQHQGYHGHYRNKKRKSFLNELFD
ncbi:zf-TFIIB domain-containing protein [Micromonospora pisi]|nr:zf-TFIIB domain-containing protein [Micromonospora pisi]